MLGLLYHHAILLALTLIATFNAPIFTNAILKNMKKNKKQKEKEAARDACNCGVPFMCGGYCNNDIISRNSTVYIVDHDAVDAFDSLIRCTAPVKRHLVYVDPASKSFSTSAKFSIDILPGSPLDLLFKRFIQEKRKRKKRAIWAVTHGYEIRIPARTSDGNEYTLHLRKPSQVNSFVRFAKYIPPFQIYDKSGKLRKI